MGAPPLAAAAGASQLIGWERMRKTFDRQALREHKTLAFVAALLVTRRGLFFVKRRLLDRRYVAMLRLKQELLVRIRKEPLATG